MLQRAPVTIPCYVIRQFCLSHLFAGGCRSPLDIAQEIQADFFAVGKLLLLHVLRACVSHPDCGDEPFQLGLGKCSRQGD